MLAVLTTHPIQYQVPIWQELTRRNHIDFEVWYLSDHGVRPTLDKQFNAVFSWDLDMLGGYPHSFINPESQQSNISQFRGAKIGSLRRRFREQNVTALWVNGWHLQAYWQAAFQGSRYGIPVWLRGDTNDLRQSSGAKSIVRKVALDQLFRRVSSFMVVGTANRRFYKQFGVADKKLVYTPHCVDDVRFALTAAELSGQRAQLRAKWGVADDAILFLFAGKFIPKKRPLEILEAARLLLDAGREESVKPAIHILLVGTGELQNELEAEARALEAAYGQPIVTFAGFLNQAEMPSAYVAADCLLLPSDNRETWGLVVNEALACGLPAIVSDQCGCAEDLALPLGEDFVFPGGDTARLALSMRRVIPQLGSTELRAKTKQLADQFAMAQTVAAIEKLYTSSNQHSR